VDEELVCEDNCVPCEYIHYLGCNSSVLLMGIINLNMYLPAFRDIQVPDNLLASKISGIHSPLSKQVPSLLTFDKKLYVHPFWQVI